MKLLAIPMLLLLLSLASYGAEITSGDDVVIIGQGSSRRSTCDITTYPLDVRNNPIKDYGDPSRLSSPFSRIPDHKDNDHETDTTSDTSLDTGKAAVITFSMNSEVRGDGGFVEWRSFNNGDEMKAKQTSSAIYGNLDYTRNLLLLRQNVVGDEIKFISSENSITFFGNYYRELDAYLNEGDYIQDYFRSGAITKDSTHISLLTRYNSTNSTNYDKLTKHSTDTRFVGQSSFCAKFSNMSCSEISETYLGQIDLNRDLENREKSENSTSNKNWLLVAGGDVPEGP